MPWVLPRSLSPEEQVLAFAHLYEMTVTAAQVLLPALAGRTPAAAKAIRDG